VSRNFDDRSRKLARERFWEAHDKRSYTCPDCGRGREQIVGEFQVHHKSGNPHDNRLDQLVALCGFCHRLREDKKPSIERIKRYRQSGTSQDVEEEQPKRDRPRIYTAGRMVWENGEDSSYRASVQARSDIDAELAHPQDTYFDHGGDLVSGCVAEDVNHIDHADGVVALFEEVGQTGTMVETMHAIGQGTPTLVLFSNKIVHPPAGPAPETAERPQSVNFPQALCSVGMRMSSPLWFLINYLLGDSTTNRSSSPHPTKEWGGTNSTVAVVRKGDGSIARALRSWVENGLTTVDFNKGHSETDLERVAEEIADPRWADE